MWIKGLALYSYCSNVNAMLKKISWICFSLAIIPLFAFSNTIAAPVNKAAKIKSEIKSEKILKPAKIVKAKPIPVKLSLAAIKDDIYNLSAAYGLNYNELSAVINCESGFNQSKYGDKGVAFGIAQFHKATFDANCKGSYYNTHDQLNCMAKMFKVGQAKQWTCFNKLFGEVAYNKY